MHLTATLPPSHKRDPRHIILPPERVVPLLPLAEAAFGCENTPSRFVIRMPGVDLAAVWSFLELQDLDWVGGTLGRLGYRAANEAHKAAWLYRDM